MHRAPLQVGQARSWAHGLWCPGLGTGATLWGRWGRLQVFGSALGSLGDGGGGEAGPGLWGGHRDGEAYGTEGGGHSRALGGRGPPPRGGQ